MSEIMPTNIEAEEAILGGIMIDPGAISRVASILNPEHFAITSHQVIYRFAKMLFAEGKFPNFMLLTTRLDDHKKLEEIGGQSKIAQLVERTVSAVNIDEYAKIVVDKYVRRRLIYAANEIALLGYDQALPLNDALAQAESLIFALNKLKPSEKEKQVESAFEVCDRIQKKIEETLANREAGVVPTPAIQTGFFKLDELALFNNGNLIVIAGRSSMGKTALGMQIGFNVANDFIDGDESSKKRVLIYSLEMSNEELISRQLATESNIPFRDIQQANLFEDRFENRFVKMNDALTKVGRSELYLVDNTNTTVSSIASMSRKFQAEYGNLSMIIIDYLQLMVGVDSDSESVSAILAVKLSEAVRRLKILAGELDVPIVLLSQLNRNLESRTNKRPTLSDLRGSGGIEEHANSVLGIYREVYYDKQCANPDSAELIVLKARNAKVCTIPLYFDAQTTSFRNAY